MTAQTDRTRVLLLHGLWHGSWCWSEVTAGLAAAGRGVLAVDMAGHGLRVPRPTCLSRRPFDPADMATELSPVHGVDLDEAGGLLVSQMAALGGGAPVTVVAHSMGGAVLTRAAQLAPELVAHAVYLAAYMPASNVPAVAYVGMPENEGELMGSMLRADPATVGAMRLDLASSDPTYRERLREALYGDVAPAVAEAAAGLMSPDAPAGVALGVTTLTREGWGSVPRSYVVCTRDMALRPALQRKFVADADAAFPDNPTAVTSIDSSHSPFLSMPERVVKILLRLA
ncbi:alpha/beta fold hydrolase [Streptomyces olindensis]|uniref:alpha/beta fold hydrolase n=1 Tax=Streptomyces olindensis TaxID=358823 RepID=UPI0036B2AAC0